MSIGLMLQERIASKALEIRHSTKCLFLIVYSSLYIDNILLAAAVPVLPDYLSELDLSDNFSSLLAAPTTTNLNGSSLAFSNRTVNTITSRICATEDDRAAESAAYICALKAFVQLLITPVVGVIVSRKGHRSVLSWAVYLLATSCSVLCVADRVWHIVLAKVLHGIASAGVAISALSSIAEKYSDDEKLRTKIIGRGMGAVAMGVLVGYPYGGIVYHLLGKDAVFIGIMFMLLPVLVVTFLSSLADDTDYICLQADRNQPTGAGVRCLVEMLTEPVVLIATGATLLSSASIAILEPTLPVLLGHTFKTPRWKIGTVFLPDSTGYFIGTYFFTSVTRHQSRAASMFLSLFGIGVALFLIAHVSGVWQLIVPHFIIGLAIGCTDVSVLSLLASFGDIWYYEGCYSLIYALNQAAVCAAYALGPAWAGLTICPFGFRTTITALALLNLVYAPFTLTLRPLERALTRVHEKMAESRDEE